MSAFICSSRTTAKVAALVFNTLQGKENSALINEDLSVFKGKTFAEIYAQLYAYNVESVNYRYGENTPTEACETEIAKYNPELMVVGDSSYKALATYVSMRSWLYQSSEKDAETPLYRAVYNLSRRLRDYVIKETDEVLRKSSKYAQITRENWC